MNTTTNKKKPQSINPLLSPAAHLILPYLPPPDLSSISLTCKALHLIVKSITAVRSSDASRTFEKYPIPFINTTTTSVTHHHPYSYFLYTPTQFIPPKDDPTRLYRQPWGSSFDPRPDPDPNPNLTRPVEDGYRCECERPDPFVDLRPDPDPNPNLAHPVEDGYSCECERPDSFVDPRPDPDPDPNLTHPIEDGYRCECERPDSFVDPRPDPDPKLTHPDDPVDDGNRRECERPELGFDGRPDPDDPGPGWEIRTGSGSDGDLSGCPCSRLKVSGLMWECGSGCKCGAGCRNRVTQGGVSVRLKIVRSLGKGWGLHADEFIRSGEFVCEYAGELLTTKEARRRQIIYDKLASSGKHTSALLVAREHLPSGNACMRINIDATRIGNVARFINHSCDGGNLSTVLVRSAGDLLPRVCFFASRDILKDEELTFSYGDSGLNTTGSKCFCGSSCCSGFMPSEHT